MILGITWDEYWTFKDNFLMPPLMIDTLIVITPGISIARKGNLTIAL